jgi:hypothetical protein
VPLGALVASSSTPTSWVPHMPQNRIPTGLGTPQLAQNTASREPQLPQKR